MTALAVSPARRGRVATRRALGRWTWRLFRREWRSQLLVITLIAVAVAAATGSATLVHNAGQPADDDFGSAAELLHLDGSDPGLLRAGLAAARRTYGTIETVGHRSVPIPGSVETLDFRAQAPHGPFAGGLLAVRSGRYPAGPGEVAVTGGVADVLRLRIGSTLALDGRRRTVVGIVENPRKLSDEFALVTPASAGAPDHVSVLVANAGRTAAFARLLPKHNAFAGSESRGSDHNASTLVTFAVATVFLLLASLIAAAGFAVVAQRRLRQVGVLAAVGATPKHVRFVLMGNGAIVGALAALCGTIAGVALWFVAAPAFESAVDHRIARFSLPWGQLALTVAFAILGAIAAAWWPGRSVARLPIMSALSGRPPKPRPARHAAITAALLIGAGIGCLALSDRDRAPLIVAGIVATIAGCLLLGPPAISIFGRLAGRLSIAPRLALRDLVRYRARSGAALAAVTLALGIAATVVVIASAEQAKKTAEPPNLSDRQLRVYLGPAGAPGETPVQAVNQIGTLEARVRRLAGRLDGATVVPLAKVLQPGDSRSVIDGMSVFSPTEITKKTSPTFYRVSGQLLVATPAVLRYIGVDPGTIDQRTDFVADPSVATRQLVIPSMGTRREYRLTGLQRVATHGRLFGNPWGDSGAQAPVFITVGGLRRRGWTQIPAGWMLQTTRPLTSEQVADARRLAASAGLTLEARRGKTSFATTMALATAAGALLALAILAMTVGLIRSEAARDLRTLTATGATSRVRRALTATTAGALALLGAILGIAGAYIVLLATYADDLGYLSHMPVLYLGLALLGVPLAAMGAGWLVAGREPPAIARTVIE
jgi:putative ABC transport system permease protein